MKCSLEIYNFLEEISSQCCSHAFWETNSLRRTMQIVECSLLHRGAQGSLLLAKDPDQHL